MNILVINCGSTSLKYDLIDMQNEETLWAGRVERIGVTKTTHSFGCADEHTELDIEATDLFGALNLVLETLTDSEKGPLHDTSAIGAVAHRIGHGGSRLLPDIPHVAVFDTAFHHSIPDEAAIYGLPYEFFHEKGIRKFGFHGNSHEYAAIKAAEFLETPLKRLNIVTCHLGGGSSVCAIQRGRSIDNSLGFSSLPGLIMGTRVGDLDPGVVLYLMRVEKMSLEEVEQVLSRQGGMLGISGVSSDMREILAAADKGDGQALLAIKAFCYRVKLYIGAYTAAMGSIDVLAFTGGIGEHSRGIRARCLQDLEKLGIGIDHRANDRCDINIDDPVCDLTARHSQVTVLAVAADEELMMARQCARALDYKRSIQHDVVSTDRRPIRVAVSAHHVHLCRNDVEALFGEGHQLTKKAALFIESQFACEETVNLIGPRGRVDRVRVLGPERAATQVEVSRTEEFKLGIDAPIRASGDLAESPGLTLEGPAGRVNLPEGVICAQRHIHMTPADAELYGVQNSDMVMVKMEGERELIFGEVLIRVKDSYKLEMHIDTDEANAAELPRVSQGYLAMIESREIG
ncbi:MAG: acetate/propionate family kinase [Deltaproteobacteria bacterium]|nr:acetate/propionate family kinase [Deltaproteobacteria bacterium]